MKSLTTLLLLLIALTASASDFVPQRGCRVGKHNPQAVQRRTRLLQSAGNPYIGNRHQLVVLASFQDQDFAEGHPAALATWNNIFNTENYSEGSFFGSVHDYFMAQSYGQFNLTFDLLIVELPDVCWKYRSTYEHDEYSQFMVDDIVDVLQTQTIDWSLYDWDGDSFVDQLLIIYAGKGMNAGGGSSTIWPHQWWLSRHENLETADDEDFRSYRTITVDAREYYIDSYCCVQEVVNTSDVETSFGTLCHEYSHCFGLPDFYEGSTSFVGEWDLMDYGNYSDRGFRPCGYSAHERMLMGWLTPTELTSPASITDMPALCDEPQAYLIRNDGSENEYYIVENRQQKGWDEKLPGSGIVIFHVDYDPSIWESSVEVTNSSSKKRYYIFPANNKSRLTYCAGWAYPYMVAGSSGNDSIANNCLTNTSKPAAKLNNANTDGKLLMSKPITQLSVDADGYASFVFREEDLTSISELTDSQPEEGVWFMLNGTRLINRPTTPGIYLYNGRKVLIGK